MVERGKLLNTIQNSLKSQNLPNAKKEIKYVLQIYHNYLNLLIIATDVYRASGNREKSLEYAELIIQHHPENWNGYRIATELFVLLRQFDRLINLQELLRRYIVKTRSLKDSELMLKEAEKIK